jgi:hypothetical protein
MRRLKRSVWTTLALIFLGVSWLWDQLRPPIHWIIDRIPLEALKRAIERFMARLPPYPTLIIFLIPVIALEPMKIVALWLFAKGQWFLGITTYVGTDVLRLGLVSFLFEINKEKLLSIPWFRKLYGWFTWAHEWAHNQVAPLKEALHQALREAGLLGGKGAIFRKIAAIWRYARRGGFKDA